jgi:hypothetical protein
MEEEEEEGGWLCGRTLMIKTLGSPRRLCLRYFRRLCGIRLGAGKEEQEA